MTWTAETLTDAVGTRHLPTEHPARIVCLVPSITELLYGLGLSDCLVGRTRYCIHPAALVAAVPSVGGTKRVNHGVIRTLNATHVILNREENPRSMAEQLAEYIPHIIVTHPRTPQDNVPLYRLMGGIFHRQTEAEMLARQFRHELRILKRQTVTWPRRKVIYLIWRKPWMGIARHTYISKTLQLVNWDTLPNVREPSYPLVDLSQGMVEEADFILFSSEPYPFKPGDLEAFAITHACGPEKLALIDGEMTSWYGNRAISGLRYLRRFAAQRRVLPL